MRPEDAMKIAGLPSDCVYCDYLEDGACTDEYCNRLCYPHLEGTEPKSNNQNKSKGEP